MGGYGHGPGGSGGLLSPLLVFSPCSGANIPMELLLGSPRGGGTCRRLSLGDGAGLSPLKPSSGWLMHRS